MKKKKGVSPLISWVLLVGFVVGLSLVITTWVRNQTDSTTDALEKEVEGDLRCNDVALNAQLDCSGSPVKLTIANKGKFTIHKVILRQPGDTYRITLNVLPTQDKTENLNSFDNHVEADIIPIIQVEGKDVVCSTRKIVTAC